MWDDKKFFEDFVKESESIKPDEDFVEKVVAMTKAERNNKVVSFSGISKILTTAAVILLLVVISGIGFGQLNSGEKGNVTKPDMHAAGNETINPDKGQTGNIEDIVNDKIITIKSMLQNKDCQVKDVEGNFISDKEKVILLSKIEGAEEIEKISDNIGDTVSYTFVEDTSILVQIVDDKYLIIDGEQYYLLNDENS